MAEDQTEDARPYPPARSGAHAVLHLSPALAGRTGVDDCASVFLQRDLLHLCPCSDRLLRDRSKPDRMVHFALRGRQFPWAAVAWPAVRYAGTPRDDHAHLCGVGRSACAFGLSVCDRGVERADPAYCMDGNRFLR